MELMRTYRDTWPHEYVLLQKDDQRELLEVVCQRIDGEGVPYSAMMIGQVLADDAARSGGLG